jgi:hypothetical protein
VPDAHAVPHDCRHEHRRPRAPAPGHFPCFRVAPRSHPLRRRARRSCQSTCLAAGSSRAAARPENLL